MGKFLITLGIVIVLLGLGWLLLEQMGLEKLPGDIVIRGEHTTFFFPITTCIILSVLLTVFARFFSR